MLESEGDGKQELGILDSFPTAMKEQSQCNRNVLRPKHNTSTGENDRNELGAQFYDALYSR